MIPDGVTVREIIAILAIILGPVTAVCITLWWQQRKEKRDAKMRVFITLMSYRTATPLTPEWVTALNLIDVVFADHAQVVALWHQLFDLLYREPFQKEPANRKHIEMLSAMAAALGFQKLQQLDIDKYYYPRVYEEQQKAQALIQGHLIRALEKTEHFGVEKKSD